MSDYTRRNTKKIIIGGVTIGDNTPIVIQSMTNTDTRDITKTVAQISQLAAEGCEIVRVSVPNEESATVLPEIKKQISLPLIADIHFDYRLAVAAAKNGADKIRINPGNIGSADRLREIATACKEYNIPIRIGVNSGSLEQRFIDKYEGVTPEGITESLIDSINLFEKFGFYDLILSVKASSVPFSINAYERVSRLTDYPLHVGITEAGTIWSGSIKSAVGIGSILSRGIGDTIRVSLTGDPVNEIPYAKEILKSLGLRKFGIEFISCPTCARTKIDLEKIANEIESKCKDIKKNIRVAVMGCAVNGPGESKEADIGVAAGEGYGLIFKRGKPFMKCKEEDIVDTLYREIMEL